MSVKAQPYLIECDVCHVEKVHDRNVWATMEHTGVITTRRDICSIQCYTKWLESGEPAKFRFFYMTVYSGFK